MIIPLGAFVNCRHGCANASVKNGTSVKDTMRSCALDIDLPPADVVGCFLCQQRADNFFRDIYEGRLIFNTDLTDTTAGNIGMMGEAAHDVANIETVCFATAQCQAHHPFFMGSAAGSFFFALILAVACRFRLLGAIFTQFGDGCNRALLFFEMKGDSLQYLNNFMKWKIAYRFLMQNR